MIKGFPSFPVGTEHAIQAIRVGRGDMCVRKNLKPVGEEHDDGDEDGAGGGTAGYDESGGHAATAEERKAAARANSSSVAAPAKESAFQ